MRAYCYPKVTLNSSTSVLYPNNLPNREDSRVNAMFDTKTVLFVLPIYLFAIVICEPVHHLDVFIARKELKRFYQEFDFGDFYIIRKGVIDNFVQNKATGFLPAIDPSIQSLELKFQSKYKVYYRLFLSSSDRSVMKLPTASIKPNGLVTKKARPFKIRFPCTRRKTGIAMLTIKMQFMLPARKKSPIAEFDLSLRRSCEKVKENAAPKPAIAKTNYICSKKCDKVHVMRRFCLSDFAIRVRVESSSRNKNGRKMYKVRVTKLYKRSRVDIGRKINIEIHGREITCNCEPLREKKTYLILGKENARTKTFFLDDYTYAIDWFDNGKETGKTMAKLNKKRKICPKRFGTKWYPFEKS